MVPPMKTTIDLSDDLFHEVKQLAAAEGTTMRSLLEEGLRAVIAQHRDSRRFALRDQSVPGSGLTAEFANASWARIRDAGYGDRG